MTDRHRQTTVARVLAAALALTAAACGGRPGAGTPPDTAGTRPAALRLGHFPNITHAQALLGRRSGSFERAVGRPIDWVTFNAGPSAVEALFAEAVDAVYVGPNPAINGFLKSAGRSFVVVAGACSGGAALVLRPSSGIRGDGDFHGRTVATPQLGNTQDVAARIWFQSHGYVTRDKGGDLNIVPLANPDQLTLMKRGEIDAAWTVEPWVSRLEAEAGGVVYLDERALWPGGRFPTALLVVRRAFLEAQPDVVRRLVAAHVEVTLRLRNDAVALAPDFIDEIRKITTQTLPIDVVRSALGRVEFTWDPMASALAKSAEDAQRVGFLSGPINLDGLVDRRLLDQVLNGKERGPGGARP